MDPDLDIFGPYGWDTDAGDDWSAGAAINPLALTGHLDQEYLLIAEPWVVGEASEDDLNFQAPYGDLDDWGGSETVRRTLYLASTEGRSTANDDEPPAQYVAGLLMPWSFGQRLFEGIDPLQHGSVNTGLLRMQDPDGALNGLLLGRNWDSVPITLKRGPRGAPYSSFTVVGRYRSAGLLRDQDEKQLRVRDLVWQLDAPLHGETFSGTGGLEGDARLTGQIKPWALGYCFNVEPVMLSEATQIFQWSLSSSEECIDVRHGAADVNIDADYPDYAALAAATIPSGECATCLAESLVRLNLTLEFGVRVDVIGDADVVNGHGTPLTRAMIALRLATHRGANYLDEASEIDFSSFQRMEAWHSAEVGWFFGSETTKLAALRRVLAGILGWPHVRPDGRLTVGWLEAPELLTAAVTFEFGAYGMGKPRLVENGPPRRGTRIGYAYNNAPQKQRTDFASGTSEEDMAIYGDVARFSQALRPAIGTLYPTSQIVTIADSGFRLKAASDLEAERQQNIYDVERSRWVWDMQVDPHVDLVGAGAGLNGAPDVVGEGQAMLCVGLNAAGSSVSLFEFFV